MRRKSSADHSSTAFSQESLGRLKGSRNAILDIKIFKDITVLRYYISKIVFTEEILDPMEVIVLWEAYESVVKKIALDPAYRAKYGEVAFRYRAILQSLDSIIKKAPKQRFESLSQYRNNRGCKFASKSYYYIVGGNVNASYRARVKQLQDYRPPPKRFIGIGYGDHGTAKDLSYDASPSWQEVALVNGESEYAIDNSRTSKELAEFARLKVHPIQLW